MPAEQHRFTLLEAVRWVADLTYSRFDAESAIRGAGIDDQIKADGLLVGSEAQGRKPLPSIVWLKGPIEWEKSRVANFTDVRIERDWLQARFAPWPALDPDATKSGTILFSKLASEISALASSGHTAETALALLVKDAVIGAFAQLGWNMHANRLRRDSEEYLRHARRRLVDEEGRRFGVTYDQGERFEQISPMTVIEQLCAHRPLNDAQRGYNEKIKEWLTLPEKVLLGNVANEPLPEEGSESRIFLEALAITIEEAQAFCARHSLAVLNALLFPPAAPSTAPPETPDHSMEGGAASRAAAVKVLAGRSRQDRGGRRRPKYFPALIKAVMHLEKNGKLLGRGLCDIATDCRTYIRANTPTWAAHLPRSRQGFEKQIKKAIEEIRNHGATKPDNGCATN